MTNLQKTMKIWEETMGREMPKEAKRRLSMCDKKYQTVETLITSTLDQLNDACWYYLNMASKLDGESGTEALVQRYNTKSELAYATALAIKDFKAKYTKNN